MKLSLNYQKSLTVEGTLNDILMLSHFKSPIQSFIFRVVFIRLIGARLKIATDSEWKIPFIKALFPLNQLNFQ